MAFNYGVLKETMSTIDSDKDALQKLFDKFNSEVETKVGNTGVWSGESATEFKGKWTKFSEESFPVAVANFNKEVTNLNTAIDAYQSAEGTK